MTSSSFSALFLVALGVGLMCRLWLARRQAAHVAAHRAVVPAAIAFIYIYGMATFAWN